MADRRMFSKRITTSARFLKMPHTAQVLYFQLGLFADDDGVVEAYPVIQMSGTQEEDLSLLEEKGFIKILNDDLVTYLFDWQENNKIRADRKTNSIYLNLLQNALPDIKTQEPKQRADVAKKVQEVARVDNHAVCAVEEPDNQAGQEPALTDNHEGQAAKELDVHDLTCGRNMDVQWTQHGRHRIGKDRIGEDRIGEDNIAAANARTHESLAIPVDNYLSPVDKSPPVDNCVTPKQVFYAEKRERDTVKGEVCPVDSRTMERAPNSHESGKETADVFRSFSDNIHPITGEIEQDKLIDITERYGAHWVTSAIKEAALSNGRSMKYITAILERWDRDGFQSKAKKVIGLTTPRYPSVKNDSAQDMYAEAMAILEQGGYFDDQRGDAESDKTAHCVS